MGRCSRSRSSSDSSSESEDSEERAEREEARAARKQDRREQREKKKAAKKKAELEKAAHEKAGALTWTFSIPTPDGVSEEEKPFTIEIRATKPQFAHPATVDTHSSGKASRAWSRTCARALRSLSRSR